LVHIEKWIPDRPITAVYYEPEKELHYVKRFLCEVTSDKMVSFLPEKEGAYVDVVSTDYNPRIRLVYSKRYKETKHLKDKILELRDFIDVKGMKVLGNQLTKLPVKEILDEPPFPHETWQKLEEKGEEGVENNENQERKVELKTKEENPVKELTQPHEREAIGPLNKPEKKAKPKDSKASNTSFSMEDQDAVTLDSSEQVDSLEWEVNPKGEHKLIPKSRKKRDKKDDNSEEEDQMRLF
jgi:topoisomerase-4 subunit A